MGEAVLEVVDLEIRRGLRAPVSFEIARGEIHGLLFPPGVEHHPFLRALAGVDRPAAGRVRMPSGPVRVVMSPIGGTVADAFGTPADVVLIDDAPVPANDQHAHDLWARFATERGRGTAIVIATSSAEQAYRSDRVSLAMWDEAQLRQAYQSVSMRITSLVDEFIRLMEEGRSSSYVTVARRLQRLNQATRDLVGEGRKHARTFEQYRELSALSRELTSHQLDNSLLREVIREEEE